MIDLDGPPAREHPNWGRRVHVGDFYVELVPAAPRKFNVCLPETFASISFAGDEGISTLADAKLRSYSRSAYEFIVAPPNFPLRGKSDSAPEVLVFVFAFETIRSIVASAAQLSEEVIQPRVILGSPRPFITELALRMRRHLLGDRICPEYLRSLSIIVISEMLRPEPESGRRGRQPGVKDGVIQVLISYINQNMSADLSLERLSALAGCEKATFARAFKRVAGMSLRRFVLSQRIEHARTEILSTNRALSEIAADTGFSSHSHMTTAFKRQLGVGPNELRNIRAG